MGRLSHLTRYARDRAWTVLAQWLRHGLPVVAVLSALGTTMFVFTVTSLLRRPLQPISLGPGDDDVRVLLFLAVMVILLTAIVIMFTVCFWLLVLKRNGRARRA